ncbi:MAG: hypothetical protein WCL14_04140 [Bacteroidota bacterium]
MHTFKFKNYIIYCCFILMLNQAYGQLVSEKFQHTEYIENFDADKQNWPIFTNADNLFVIQNGDYILNRKNSSTQYVAFTNWENQLESFDMKVNLKLEQAADDEGNIGIIFMAHPNGGFVFEYNRNRQYRVKQLNGTSYKYITSDDINVGWVKSNDIKPMGQYNTIEVKCFNKDYDIYINGMFQFSFTEKTYTFGKMGIIIGPSSNGLVDYFYVYSNKKYSHSTTPVKDTVIKKSDTKATSDTPSDMVSVLSETVVKLKTQNNKLVKENEELKRLVAYSDNPQIGTKPAPNKDSIFTEENIKIIREQIEQVMSTNDSLKRMLFTYKKVQDMLKDNENGDIIISLTNTLKDEKVKNDFLMQRSSVLADSLNYYKTLYNKYKPIAKPLPPKTNTTNRTNPAVPKTKADSTGTVPKKPAVPNNNNTNH